MVPLPSFTLNLLLFFCWSRGDPSLFRLFDWLIEYQCQTAVMWRYAWLGWLIFDFLLKGWPPLLSFALFPSVSGIRVRGWEVSTVNIKWLIGAVTVDPSGPWLPDVLVHWCQQQDLSLGFARVCRGGQTVQKRLPSRVLSLTRACHSYCLFLYSSLSVDCWCWCLMTIHILWCHLSWYMFYLK